MRTLVATVTSAAHAVNGCCPGHACAAFQPAWRLKRPGWAACFQLCGIQVASQRGPIGLYLDRCLEVHPGPA